MVTLLSSNRDDFSEATKRILANRVGVRCSNPGCRKPTSGANTDPGKITNIGVAAHICAAAPGGPRYDSTMTEEERKSSQNGIWLCQSCAKLIDSDSVRYSKEVLFSWKNRAESTSILELEHSFGISEKTEDHKDTPGELETAKWFVPKEKHFPVFWKHTEIEKFCKVSEGNVVLVSGYTGVGIDVFIQNIVRYNLEADSSVIYFNLKESSKSIARSMLIAESHVSMDRINKGLLTDDDWKQLESAVNKLEKWQISFVDFDLDKTALTDCFLSAVKNGNADIVVLDDLDGLCIGDAATLNAFLYQMRNAAIQSGTVVFILLDLCEIPSRMDKRPILSDPAINRLSKFCDIVQFLYFDEYDQEYLPETRKLELILAKNNAYTQDNIFYLAHMQEYSEMIECENNGKIRKSILEKYPGLLVGLKVFAEHLEKL